MGHLEKARIFAADSKESYQFYVQFNPNEIQIEENMGNSADRNIHRKNANGQPGKKQPQAQPFADKAEAQLSTKLFFNTYVNEREHTDVRAQIKQFYYFFSPGAKQSTHRKIGFAWGSLIMTGILSGMQVSYTMFAANGDPVRAEVSIRIAGDYSDRQSKEVGNAKFVEHQVAEKGLMERLKGYQDPKNWRELLGASGNRNPLPETSAGRRS